MSLASLEAFLEQAQGDQRLQELLVAAPDAAAVAAIAQDAGYAVSELTSGRPAAPLRRRSFPRYPIRPPRHPWPARSLGKAGRSHRVGRSPIPGWRKTTRSAASCSKPRGMRLCSRPWCRLRTRRQWRPSPGKRATRSANSISGGPAVPVRKRSSRRKQVTGPAPCEKSRVRRGSTPRKLPSPQRRLGHPRRGGPPGLPAPGPGR